jgi:hypothetical protein
VTEGELAKYSGVTRAEGAQIEISQVSMLKAMNSLRKSASAIDAATIQAHFTDSHLRPTPVTLRSFDANLRPVT